MRTGLARRRLAHPWRLVALPLLAGLLYGPATAASPEAQVIQFTPQGTVKQVRQVTARFSEPMVPLGDPRGPVAPFLIACPEPGTARWLDSRTWAYDFARDLPAGIRCSFTTVPGLASLAGRPVAGQRTFAFSTGGPAIRFSIPREGDESIDEEQAFLLVLDAEATEASILQHVSFAVEGLAERIGVRFVTGTARDEILKARFRGAASTPVVILQAERRFPNGVRVNLVWGKGVRSRSGLETDENQVLPFKTRGLFTAQFSCERENRQAGCLAVTPMRVEFTAPVSWRQARQVALAGPGGKRWSPEEPTPPQEFVRRVSFPGPFPESADYQVEVPANLTDDAGRPLDNAARFPLAVRTEAFPPLAKFSARFGIVEWKADPALPVTLRNLEPQVRARLLQIDREPRPGLAGKLQDLLDRVTGRLWHIPPERSQEILPWLRRVGAASRDQSVFAAQAPGRVQEFTLPKPLGGGAFEVVGVPLAAPGLYIVELESVKLGTALLGAPRPMYVPAAALVTNLSVHFKWGRESSLVWVTSLDTGRPVSGAQVSIHDCQGTTRWQGSTDPQGIARVGPLPPARDLPRCREGETNWQEYSQTQALLGMAGGLFVLAQTSGDMSFVHSSWQQGIEPWRFRLPPEDYRGPTLVHTILDRPLYRAGETVHMKHVLRLQRMRGLFFPPEAERPGSLTLRHVGSDQTYELPLTWTASGSAENAWPIPRGARLGVYEVVFSRADRDGRREWTAARFRVEEFRVPLMRGTVRLPADPQVAVAEMPVDLEAHYLAGGGAANLPVTLRAQLRPWAVPTPEEFEGFTFANGTVREGTFRRGMEVEAFEEGTEESDGGTPARPGTGPGILYRSELVLDQVGTARTTIPRLPLPATPQDLLVEMEFRDPAGEVRTAAAAVPLWPASWIIGIQPDSWVASKDRLKAWVAVLDLTRRPVAGAPVRVEVYQRQYLSHRKRLVGGFYAYEHVEEVRRLGPFCAGVTDARGRFLCEGKPPADGNLILQASASDPAGRGTGAYQEVWVAGSEEWWFAAQDHDRIDLLPERKRYEPGETARLQVRMPFREATALVTVERGGILEASVVPLTGKEPVIEVPVRPEYAPNVYVSVLAVRGRVGGPQPTALVDLGKPAFKLGVAELRVGWRAHELKVQVLPEREVYRVRDRARVRVSVRRADGQAPPPGSEFALAAVDEGLLELAANPTWDLLEAMLRRRGYGVGTATAQMQVVGKRHYGLKALPQGGGGGSAVTRELFETLLLWRARVPLDDRGEARVEIPLNDALSSFRIVAVATGGASLFGTGAATIRSTQDLMLLSALPPLAREGDRYQAEVTLRNTSTRPMAVSVRGRVEEVQEGLAPRTFPLAPGEARAVSWELTVPAGVPALHYEVEAQEPGGASDRVRIAQQVRPVVPVRITQATLSRWEQPMAEPVERPADALPGRGGVQVVLAPRLTAGLAGVRDWMSRYPYTCLEQEVSRAVALRDEGRWKALAATLPAYLDGDGLLKYFPRLPQGSEVLTAYVLSVIHESGWRLPPDVQGRMETALRRFVSGTLIRRSALPTADLSIRKLAALEALSRYGKAEPALLASLTVEPNLWPTSAVLDWWNVLTRMAGAPNREARLREVEQIVRARLNLQGTVMGFSTERADQLWWLMVSADVNALRLILHLLEANQWSQDLPRLARGAIARQRRGAWDLTVANAWGALAIEKFAAAFERTPVGGETTAALAGASQRLEWAASPAGGTLSLPWPAAGPDDLRLAHEGTGNPWVTVQTLAAIPLRGPLSTGYRIVRTLIPVEQRQPGRWSRGDLLRVRLAIEAQSDMTWVVVQDPVPAGASHLGGGLRGASSLASPGERREGFTWPAFEERAFDAFRAYYAFAPKGEFTLEYTIRLNQSGRFQLPPTRVEALYAPEMFGERPNDPIEVQP
jgi:uncharacterized protein YfaS (alpha-2-macroglobulin family)